MQIYVRPWTPPAAAGAAAAAPSAQWQVSTAGGLFPSWRADRQALYYLSPDGAMMAAPVTTRGTALEPGTPVALFPTRIVGGGVDRGQGRQYDVTRDGRFLINTEVLLFYHAEGASRWVCAVAKRADDQGFLITAYPTDAIKEGTPIWPK